MLNKFVPPVKPGGGLFAFHTDPNWIDTVKDEPAAKFARRAGYAIVGDQNDMAHKLLVNGSKVKMPFMQGETIGKYWNRVEKAIESGIIKVGK
jgi:hypothetical protein